MHEIALPPDGPAEFRGAADVERTAFGVLARRLPAWTKAQYPDDSVDAAAAAPSGVRLTFTTSASAVELEVHPGGVVDLVVDGGPPRTARGRCVRFDGLPAGEKDVELWLPPGGVTEVLALRADAAVGPPRPTGRRWWLHHGSSISQGAEAASPTGTWPAVAAALGGVELFNLGLANNAMLDPFTARAMRGLPADLISVKAGVNIACRGAYTARTFGPAVHGFLDTVREGHPDVPLLVVSPVVCLTADLAPVRADLARIAAERAKRDPHLYYLDGLRLLGQDDAGLLPDGLHPGPAGHRRMGERFAELAFGEGGAFACGA